MKEILSEYSLLPENISVEKIGNGLINTTWLVSSGVKQFVLQKINTDIFKKPEDIAFNISMMNGYLKANHPGYLFIAAIKTVSGMEMVKTSEGYFRLFPFVENSHTIDVVKNPAQAYEAARQFGRFTKLLSGFDVTRLKITLPDFHNLSLRFQQFESSLEQGNKERISEAKELIQFLLTNKTIVEEFEKRKPSFKIRCTHHDTKISNVLFDTNDKGLCVIDLDTVMPGYFISDMGDMMRTYLCPVSEEEKDLKAISIRGDYYNALVNGYMSEMGEELTLIEKDSFLFSGKFMIYMQALRFLTDYLNNDIYYGSKYPGHNQVRANNQATLLKKLLEFNPSD